MKSRFDRPIGKGHAHENRSEPLNEHRFQDLLSRASDFFAQAERDVDGERALAIADIVQTMRRYGLTVDDLR